MKVRIYRINKKNPLPTQANAGDAGWDVYASETVEFEPDEICLVPLGIIAEAPRGYHFKLCIRSSMAWKKGFIQPNSPGIIDHLFVGPQDEIKLMLKAPSKDSVNGQGLYLEDLVVAEGDRIGQLILEKNHDIEWDEQENRDFAQANRGGFGSSGQ